MPSTKTQPPSRTRVARSLVALQALCGVGLHPEVLVPAFLEALHGLVPSSRNLFDWTDEQGRLVRYFIEGPIDAQIAQLYFDEFHNRREAEVMPAFDSLRRTPAGVRSADELDHEGFFRSDLYNEIWRPQGLRTRLEAVVRSASGRLLGSLVLYRGPGERRFSLDDERHLAAVLPSFAAALEAAGPAVADDRHVPSPEPPETLLMSLDGELCHASDGAIRLLLMAAGGASRDRLSRPLALLADPLLSMLLLRLRDRAAQWATPEGRAATALAPPPSIVHETPAGQFVARGELLRPAQASMAPLAQVTLRRLEPHRVALERALRALPITAGQIAVCRGLYAGLTQAEIGRRLGVAPATVIDHTRKVYRTLDIGSQTELRDAVDARIGLA
jgi:DNA-binding CsgD family transcriptional regulator